MAGTQDLIRSIATLATCNPFTPERFELERKILGTDSEPLDSLTWHRSNRSGDAKNESQRPNVIRLTNLADRSVEEILKQGNLDESIQQDYWAVATYLLLYRHITPLDESKLGAGPTSYRGSISTQWENFWEDYQRIFTLGDSFRPKPSEAAHLFACLTQVHRAFFNIFDQILGTSAPIGALRAQAWESIFTCSLIDYHDFMFKNMRDFSTLITGSSGTGKELVARAIGLSQYIPFDHKTKTFAASANQHFLPLNLSALTPTLIESELFGHRKGSFTGAVSDRAGWLESCGPHGCVFLDEIGELDLELQVKLLRVLQARTYTRIGENEVRHFHGKIIAATNRNLEHEIERGSFREDFYFRICSDRIQTPTLREQLACVGSDLEWMVESILRRQGVSDPAGIAQHVTNWIHENLGDAYSWPGNIRELEQCVRSYLIRKKYIPLETTNRPWRKPSLPGWLQPVLEQSLTADELTCRYCTWIYSQVGSYEQVSRIVKLDRRTVKSKIDPVLLEQLKSPKDESEHSL